jgi:hypothetical protein
VESKLSGDKVSDNSQVTNHLRSGDGPHLLLAMLFERASISTAEAVATGY